MKSKLLGHVLPYIEISKKKPGIFGHFSTILEFNENYIALYFQPLQVVLLTDRWSTFYGHKEESFD